MRVTVLGTVIAFQECEVISDYIMKALPCKMSPPLSIAQTL